MRPLYIVLLTIVVVIVILIGITVWASLQKKSRRDCLFSIYTTSARSGLQNVTRKPFVVVSMTTVPWRLHRLPSRIRDLLLTNSKIDKIQINLPHQSRRTQKPYPATPKDLENNPKVVIHRCEDYGPITKVVPTAEQWFDKGTKANPTLIVSLDDDIGYDKSFVDKCVDAWQRECFDDEILLPVGAQTMKYYGSHLPYLEGFRGVTYPASIFTPKLIQELKDISQNDLVPCDKSDDIVLAFMLSREGVSFWSKNLKFKYDVKQSEGDKQGLKQGNHKRNYALCLNNLRRRYPFPVHFIHFANGKWNEGDLPKKWKDTLTKWEKSRAQIKLWTPLECDKLMKQFFGNVYETYQKALPIQKCDMARYAILFVFGGLYSDLDCTPVNDATPNHIEGLVTRNQKAGKPREIGFIETTLDKAVLKIDGSYENPVRVANYVIYAPRGSEWMRQCVYEAAKRLQKFGNAKKHTIYTTGPDVVTTLAHLGNVPLYSHENLVHHAFDNSWR